MARYEPKDLDAIFEELKTENARALITVGGSLVEYALECCILTRLRQPQNNTEANELFSDNGVMGTFREKIWMAYYLKVVGPITRQDIDLIRRIRNEAAHNMNPISFETPEIADRCRRLYINKDTDFATRNSTDYRGMFELAVRFYATNLFMRSGEQTAEIAEAFKVLAPYLAR